VQKILTNIIKIIFVFQEILSQVNLGVKHAENPAVVVFEYLCLFLALRNTPIRLHAQLRYKLFHGMSFENLDDGQFILFRKLLDILKSLYSSSKYD